MNDTKVVLSFNPPEGQERLRIDDFIKKINAVINTMRVTAAHLGLYKESALYYEIVHLSSSSPAEVVLEARADDDIASKATIIHGRFVDYYRALERGEIPLNMSKDEVQAYKDLSSPIGDRIVPFKIQSGDHSVDTKDGLNKIVSFLEQESKEEYEYGSLIGDLEMINLHDQYTFRIYSDIPPYTVFCTFTEDIKEDAINAVNHRVRVHGDIKYPPGARFPKHVQVTSIEILPGDESLPSLSDLHGIAPAITDDQSSEDFIRRIRDEWE